MPWFKVDDNLGFHHKVIAAGNPAMGLWVRAGAVCAQQLTDGFVPDHMVLTLGTVAQARKLVAVGLWTQVEGGYRFHEWTERQPRRADVEAEREAARERMRVRRAERKAGTKPGTNARERFTSEAQPFRHDNMSTEDDRDETAPLDTSSQVSGLRSPEQSAKFGGSSPEVRDVFGNPDPTRPDPTHLTTSRELTLAEAPRHDVERICQHLATRIEANGSKTPTITAKWRDAARLMLDRDGRSEGEIHGAIDWCQDDEFWRANILSMPKLREKYDQLRMQAQRRPRSGNRQQETDALFERAALRMGITGGNQ